MLVSTENTAELKALDFGQEISRDQDYVFQFFLDLFLLSYPAKQTALPSDVANRSTSISGLGRRKLGKTEHIQIKIENAGMTIFSVSCKIAFMQYAWLIVGSDDGENRLQSA